MKTHQKIKLCIALCFAVCVANAQFLHNVNYNTTLGPLKQDGHEGKTVKEGNFFYTVGHKEVPGQGTDLLIQKTENDGSLTWQKTYSNTGNTFDYGVDVAIDGSGNVWVLGALQTTTAGYDMLLLKYNSAGDLQWTHQYHSAGTQNDVPAALVLDGSSNAYFTGAVNYQSGTDDALVRSVNSSGSLRWTDVYDYDGHEDGGIAIELSGTSVNCFMITTGDGAQRELTKREYNATTGLLANGYRTSLGKTMEIHGMVTHSGNHLVCGAIENLTSGLDFAVYKFSPTLGTVWSYTYDEAQDDDHAYALALNATGDVFAAGAATATDGHKILVVNKINGSNGAELKHFEEDVPKVFPTEGLALAVDATHVYTTGSLVDDGTSHLLVEVFDHDLDREWFNELEVTDNSRYGTGIFAMDEWKMVLTGATDNGVAKSLFIQEIELTFRDTTLFDADTTLPEYIDNQLIVSFDPDYCQTSTFDNLDKRFGYLKDYITTAGLDTLDEYFDDSVAWDSVLVFKVFRQIKSTDTLSVARNGDTLEVPPFWATLLLQFDTDINDTAYVNVLDTSCESLVVSVSINPVFDFFGDPDDPEYTSGKQHALKSSTWGNADINMSAAWDYGYGAHSSSKVKVGIYDGGFDWTHPDFSRLGKSDDLVDNVMGFGYDFYNDRSTRKFPVKNNHATKVAGIVAAWRDNGTGIAGVAGGNSWHAGCLLYDMGLKGTKSGERFKANLSDINHALMMGGFSPPVGFGLDVMNHSWGDFKGRVKPKHLNNFIRLVDFAQAQGVTMVWATTPQDNGDDYYPVDLVEKRFGIEVGASDNNSLKILLSGWGGDGVHLVAPGSQNMVYTTFSTTQSTDYGSDVGTSFAAPLVTGVATLMQDFSSASSGEGGNYQSLVLAPEDIKHLMEMNADASKIPSGHEAKYGAGLLNAETSMAALEHPEYRLVHYEKEWPKSDLVAETQNFLDIKTRFDWAYGPLKDNTWYRADHFRFEETEPAPSLPGYELVAMWPRHSASTLWWSRLEVGSGSTLDKMYVQPGRFCSGDEGVQMVGGNLRFKIGGHVIRVEGLWWDQDKYTNEQDKYTFPKSKGDSYISAYTAYFKKLVSAEDMAEGQVKIYPNPTRAQVVIEWPAEQGMVSVKLVDLAGKLIFQEAVSQTGRHTLDMSYVAPGMYMVILESGTQTHHQKVLKE